MFPRSQPFALSSSGDAQAGDFEDISTRTLQSVRVGQGAGKLSSGSGNAFVGFEAGKTNVQGSYNAMVGYQAGAQNANASYATMVGAYAGAQNQRGSEVTFVGFKAGELSRDGNQLVGIGAFALRENVSGNGTVAIGYRSAERTLDGYFNTMIGTESGQDNRSGNYNTMAGYRSGRAAFLGNENTYLGAFSGYSNRRGSANSFVGYRAGEELQNGDLNVAIGAYAMQFASTGSCNIAIGPYAGGQVSGGASENVLIGTNVATQGSPNRSVILGALAGTTMTGDGSVLIGYQAGLGVEFGNCNILIGTGASSFASSNSLGIAIGSYQTLTFTNSLSIGNSVTNQREYSVLVGNSVSSDADNSIIIGKTNTIESFVVWKDPISTTLQQAALNDGQSKLGLCNIEYSDTVISPCNEIYPTAVAKIFTSNQVSSLTNPPRGTVGPSTYDLRQYVPEHIFHSGLVIAARSSNEYAQKSTQSFATANTILSSSKTTDVSPSEVLLQNIQNRTSTTGIATLQNHSGTSNIAVNMRSLSNVFASVPITCVLHHTLPIPTTNLTQSSLSASTVSNIIYPISLSNTFTIPVTCNIDDIYIYDSVSNQLRYVVEESPQFGSLNHAIYTSLNDITYTPYAECCSTVTDQFVLRPHYFIKDGASEYGMRSDDTCTVQVQLSPSDLITPDHAILSNMVYMLDSNTVYRVPHIASNTYVNVMYMPPNFVLHTPIQATPYTFNDVFRSVACNVYDYTPEAYGSYLQTIDVQFSNVLIMEQQYASNLCYILNDVIHFSTQLAAEPTLLPEEVSTVNDITEIAQALVQLVQEPAPPTIVSSNASVFLTAKVEEWVNLYDSFPYEYAMTNLIIESNQSWYNSYITAGVYDTWQNTFSASNQFAANLEDANILSNITANYQANVATNITFDPHILEAATNIYPSFNTIFRSYFRERRIFITYEDLCNGKVYFESNVENFATDPQVFDIRVEGITKRIPIQIEGLANNVWTDIEWGQSNGLEIRLPFHSNIEIIPLDFSVYNGYATHYVLKQPTIGRVQQGNYISKYPWASNDQFHLVLKNIDGNTADLPVYVTYDVGSRFNPITLIQPPNDILTTTVSYRSYGTIPNTFSVSNTIQHTRFDNGVQVLDEFTTQHIPTYNPSVGYRFVLSNEEITSTTTILSTFGNINYTCNLSTKQYTYDSLSSIWTESPLTTVTTQLEVPQEDVLALATNIEYNYLLTTISSNYYAYNSNTYVVERDDILVQHLDSVKDTYLYSTSQVDLLRDPLQIDIFSTLTLATTSVLSSNINYVSACSNIISKEGFVPLTKHHIALNGYDRIVFNTTVTPSPYTIVQSNIGPVSQCTYADILQNKIYIKWASDEAPPLPQQPLPNLTTSVDNLPVSMAYGSPTIVNVFPPISKSFAIDTLIPAPIDDVIYACVRRFLAAFSPAMIHVHNVQSGYLSRDGSNIATQCPWLLQDELRYVPSPNITNDVIELFFSGDVNDVTNVFRIPIYVNFTPTSFGQVINMGINTQLIKNSLSPRNFFHSFNNLSLANIGIEPLVSSLTNIGFRRRVGSSWVTISTFTMQDVVNGQVFVVFTTNALQSTIQYSVYSGVNTLAQNQTFTFYRIDHDAHIPGIVNSFNPSFELSCIGENATNYKNTLENTIRGWYTTLTQFDSETISPSAIEVRIYERPRHGILVHTSSPNKIVGRCTLLDILQNKLRYISRDPSSVIEDYVELRFIILSTNEMSPKLRLHVRHFYSHFTPYAKNTAFVQGSQRLLHIPPRSISMVNDNLVWRSASGTTVPFSNATASPQATYQTLWNLPPYSNGSNAAWTVYTYSSHGHISIPTAATTLYVDQADSISLSSLSNYIPQNHAYALDMYILSPPRWGSIQNKNTAHISNKYSITEVLNGDVIYQHVGVREPLTDSFIISFASSPYTLAYNSINVSMTIQPIPVVATNINKYVYYDTYAQSNTIERFDSSSLSFTGAGYVHVLSETNLQTVDVQNMRKLSFDTYQSNVHGFRISSNVFDQYPYPSSSFQFTMNTHPEYYVNSLYEYSPYRDVFVNTYTSYTNQHTDSNIILADINRNQVIAYDVNNTPAIQSALLDKIITIAFELYPEASYYHPQFDLFLTDAFTLTLYSATGYLLRFYVYNRTWTLELESGATYTGIVPSSLTRNVWNTFKIVNFDPRNDYQLSIYWKFQSSDQINLTQQFNIPAIALERCVRYEFLVDVESPIAYTSSSNYVKQLPSGLRIQFALYNSHLSYRIRNFQVNISTYNVNDNLEYDPDSHNIIIGKDINVQGVNNICMGNRFVTSGNQSIIVGNNIGGGIGQTVTSVNDIFQSIVLGNESFRNSIVRDIICIGNNNFNNLSEQDAQKTRLFFAQKPIVIGNSVDASKIDYNINIGNVFLSTTIFSKQVYLGQDGQCVGIGYTTNAALSAAQSKLYVSGNIKTDAVVANQYTRSVICPYDVAPYSVMIEMDENDNAVVCTTQMNTMVCGVAKESYVRLDGQYDVIVTSHGKTKVWCKGAVQRGELLISDDYGCVVSRGTDTVKHSFTFAKSLSAWDPNNPFATPSVSTSNIAGYGDIGLISCIVLI